MKVEVKGKAINRSLDRYDPLDVAGTAAANVAIKDLMNMFYLMNEKFTDIMTKDPLLKRELAKHLGKTYKEFLKAWNTFLTLNGMWGNKNREIARRIMQDLRYEKKEKENEKV